MKMAFLELILNSSDCKNVGIESRDEIEDELENLVESLSLGRVSGGGGGMGLYNIDIDIFDDNNVETAIEHLRRHLRALNIPQSSRIYKHKPVEQVYLVYE